jgi:hypothetical protein
MKNEEEREMIDYNEVDIIPFNIDKKEKKNKPKINYIYKNFCCLCMKKKKKNKNIQILLDSKTILV